MNDETVMNVEDRSPITSIGDAGSAVRATLDIEGRMKRNPYGMLAAALGVGFIVGGGLFTRLSARIFGAAFRIALIAALPLLQKELLEPAKRATGNGSEPADARDRPSRRA